MHQWRIAAFAEGGDEAVGGQFLAGAGARRFGGQCGFECLEIEGDVLGEAINQQVAKPHEGVILHKRESREATPS
ncbi:hypothetical protein D3C72_2012530 [compost metagenome]